MTKKDGVCRYDSPDGRAAFKKKDYRRAVKLLTAAIEWTESNCRDMAWSRTGLGQHYKFRAAAYTVLQEYEHAVRDLVAMEQADLLEWGRGDDRWVFEAYNGAVKRQPGDPFFLGARASAYYSWGTLRNDEQREKYFRAAVADRDAQLKLVRTKKERAEVLAARAAIYGGTGNFGLNEPEPALTDISAAIELDPKAEYYYQRAILRWKEPKLAFEDISKAIELKPTGWYYKKRAEIRGRLKQPPQAVIDDLSAALAITPPDNYNYPDYLQSRAYWLKQIGKLNEAEKDYAALVKADPKDAYKRRDRMLVLLELGRDKDAEAERKLIEKLDAKALNRSFVCKAAGVRAKRGAEAGAAGPDDLRKAWTMGTIVALVPLQHLMGKPNEQADKAWATISNLVRVGEKDAGKEARGLDAIPEFKGSKRVQTRQAIAFIFNQRKKVEAVLADKLGDRARALFAVSSAGSMAVGLNRVGVPNLNRQLARIIEEQAGFAGLPCDIWFDTVSKTAARAKPTEVIDAWNETRKDVEQFLSKS